MWWYRWQITERHCCVKLHFPNASIPSMLPQCASKHISLPASPSRSLSKSPCCCLLISLPNALPALVTRKQKQTKKHGRTHWQLKLRSLFIWREPLNSIFLITFYKNLYFKSIILWLYFSPYTFNQNVTINWAGSPCTKHTQISCPLWSDGIICQFTF